MKASGPDIAGAVEGPEIAVDPLALDYGLVPVGEAVSEVVTVTNEGTDTLKVPRLVVAEGGARGYAVTLPEPTPWRLEPGESREVVVTFTPVDTAEALGTLVVQSDDADEPEVPVALSNATSLPCDDSYGESMPWTTSGLWYGDTGPVDAAGNPWYAAAFDDASWQVLAGLPDIALGPEENDVFYRARFTLAEVVGTTRVEFEGNDGVWLYVNETFVGHWGGEWRDGGCINDSTGSCSVNYVADPADITQLLVPGENTIAVMLTNGPADYFLDIRPTCVAGG